jgi:putative FmdB family regulatory protein
MPLYEYFCDACGEGFEALVSFGASDSFTHGCPGCGGRSRRILSAVNFARERRTPTLPQGQARDGKPDVTSLRLPPAARLCWMDNQSAARLAAYKAGRGAEYDDTVATRNELASRRGEERIGEQAQMADSHSPDSHSPLSDPAVLANRRNAAQKEKLIESATITEGSSAKEI